MRTGRTILAIVVVVIVLAGGVALITHNNAPATATSQALRPDARALGVSEPCCATKQLAATTSFASWLGAKPTVVGAYLDNCHWSNLDYPNYFTSPFEGTGYTVVYPVPMLMSDTPGCDGGTLQQGADGQFDHHYVQLARTLVAEGQGSAVLRLGWEMNGNWYAWSAAKDPTAFVEYWRQIVTVMRAVPGADFNFDFNIIVTTNNLNTIPLVQGQVPKYFPGSAYVNSIGLDIYDSSYPLPVGTQATEQQQSDHWQLYVSPTGGLTYWAALAKSQNLPMNLPEWGLMTPSVQGGGDNPSFIDGVDQFVQANTVQFQSYFDVSGGQGNHQLRSGNFPRASTRYQQIWG